MTEWIVGFICGVINYWIGFYFGRKSKVTQGWIPVTERLPDKDGDYLASYVFCNEVVTDKVRYTARLGFYYDSVIAWQPLPTSYK